MALSSTFRFDTSYNNDSFSLLVIPLSLILVLMMALSILINDVYNAIRSQKKLTAA